MAFSMTPTKKTRQRDKLKNSICDRLDFPVLRIDSNYLERVGNHASILEWVIEMWYMGKEFQAMQERGELSSDEDFYPLTVYEWGYIDSNRFIAVETTTSVDELAELAKQGKRLIWRPYDPFSHYILSINRFASKGICKEPFPKIVQHTDFETGYSEALAIVSIDTSHSAVGNIKCRMNSFLPMGSDEICLNLAIVDLAVKLQNMTRNIYRPMSNAHLDRLIQRFAQNRVQG